MSAKTKTVVADQKTADAFKALGIDAVVKGSTEDTSTTEDDKGDVVLLKGQVTDLEKAIGEKDAEIAELKKGITPGDTLSKAHVDALALITKSVFDTVNGVNAVLEGFAKAANEKLESIENEVLTIGSASAGRRTVNNSATMKKAFEVDDKSGKKVLSKSQHARQLITLLDGLADSPETQEMYGDAVVRYETSRQITKAVEIDLLNNHDIQIID